jgi:hypothetical protein
MSKQSAKTELGEILTGTTIERNTTIYGYNCLYKSYEYGNFKRKSIDLITDKEAMQFVEDGKGVIFYFLAPGNKIPTWMDNNYGRVISVDSTQEDLLKRFFACNFPVIEYASQREYFKGRGYTGEEGELYRSVTKLWIDYMETLRLKQKG